VAIRSISRGPHLGVGVGAWRRHHVRHCVDRLAQLAAGDDCLDRFPHLPQRQLLAYFGDLEQHLHRGGQPCRVPGQPGMPAGPLLVGGCLGLAEQLGCHQQVQQLQAVVDRPGLQVGDGRQQRGQPSLGAVPAQCLGARRHPVPGKVHHPAVRHVRVQVQRSDPYPADLGRPVQRLLQVPAARLGRALAPALQIRVPRPAGHHHQMLQGDPLVHAGQACQRRVQVVSGLLPDPGHDPRQRRHPWQQHRVGAQPLHPVGEHGLGPLSGVPCPGPHPLRELSLGLGELPQPVGGLDLVAMLERRGAPLCVPFHA
jgi:hypothetical protein